jgi:hypothetical protein
VSGKPETHEAKGELKRSKGNGKHCLTTEDVSKRLAAHIVPPRVVQTNHSPSTQTQMHSGTHRDPPYGHHTAISSTQLQLKAEPHIRRSKRSKLREAGVVSGERSNSNVNAVTTTR